MASITRIDDRRAEREKMKQKPKKQKAKPVYAWAISHPKAGLQINSLKTKRKWAQDDFALLFTWKKLFSVGFRCVKVKIEEV